MSEIFATTMNPTKHELLGAWLPAQSWFVGEGAPVLENVGGFRLDDPAGEVGIEFIIVRDNAPRVPVTYHVPLAYRGAPLAGSEASLLGTSEHGVLGTRWIYDGEFDPVFQTQVKALAAGVASAQHQSISHTAEPLVKIHVAFGAGQGIDSELRRATVIRRPISGGTGSAGASAWVSVPWATDPEPLSGAVLEIS